ncbi:MAG TPA: porin family protein [Candidatus Krumholzibacteria bacterium]|nr:porin family protein [Candidatus Krumholzibacteria bacterium]
MNRIVTIFVVCGLLCTVTAAVAQEDDMLGWDGVVYGGMSQAKMSGDNQPFSGSDSRNAFTGGVGFLLRVDRQMGFEFGLRYAQKGADGNVDLTDYNVPVNGGTQRITGNGTTKLDYIELPVTIAGYLPTGKQAYLRGYLGLSLAVLTSAKFEGTLLGQPVSTDIKSSLDNMDFCWLVGASWTYEFENWSLWADARFVGGARSVDNSSADYNTHTSTREFALGAGIPLAR